MDKDGDEAHEFIVVLDDEAKVPSLHNPAQKIMNCIFQRVSSLPHLNLFTPRSPAKTLSSLVASSWPSREKQAASSSKRGFQIVSSRLSTLS